MRTLTARAVAIAFVELAVAAGPVPAAVHVGLNPTATSDTTSAISAARRPRMTAMVGGVSRMEVRSGETIALPVILDLFGGTVGGKLGAVQFDLRYDPALLVYSSATPGVRGPAMINLVEPGRLRFAFAATEPQDSATITLLTAVFQVASTARVGAQQSFRIEYSGPVASTTLEVYPTPVTRAGSLRIAAH